MPNLQVIPIRTDEGRRIRKALANLLPTAVSVDYAALEARIAARSLMETERIREFGRFWNAEQMAKWAR